MKKIICNCKDWGKSMEQIVAAQHLAFAHGDDYTGTRFKYCPWCSNELKEVDDET